MKVFEFPLTGLEIIVDNTTGVNSIRFEEKSRMEGVDFSLTYNAQLLSSTRGVNFKEIKETQGSDDFGPYEEISCFYSLVSRESDEKPISLEKILRIYKKNPIIFCRTENTCSKPLFPKDSIGGITIEKFHDFEAGLYSCHRNPWWTVTHFAKDWRNFPDWGNFLLINFEDGVVGCIVPVNGRVRTRLKSEDGRLMATASGMDNTKAYNVIPVCVISFGRNPYETVRLAYDVALEAMGHPTKKREQKSFPEIFEYLGWCSWNAFGRAVSEKDLIATAATIKNKKLPIRFFLIDDGWMSNWDKRDGERLSSFHPDPKKFSPTFKPVVGRLKRDYRIKHVGIWHTLQGYWRGIEPDSELHRKYHDFLLQGANEQLIPNPLAMKAFKFYCDWYEVLRSWGIDFVKVDNQGSLPKVIANIMPIDEAAGNLFSCLQAAVNLHLLGMINCMGMSLECSYHWLASNVSRASDDYAPGDKNKAKEHIMDSVYNALWFSQLAYPDYDMFQSHDPYAKAHALARVISGGPVYLTDKVNDSDIGLIDRLCFEDGRILRPDVPALPTRDCLFRDPFNEPLPLKAFTKVDGIGLVMAVNVNKDGMVEEVEVKPGDAELHTQETCAIYSYFRDRLDVVTNDRPLRQKLNELECELFIISPIKEKFAPIGLVNKFIAPKGVTSVEKKANEIRIRLREPGTFLAHLDCEDIEVFVDDKKCAKSEQLSRSNTFTFKDRQLRVRAGAKNIEILT